MRTKTKLFGEVKNVFEEAELLLTDEELKEEAVVKKEQCDKLAEELMEVLEGRLKDLLDSAGDVDPSDQDLLAIYHAFSVEIESLLAGEQVEDPGLEAYRPQGAARGRLDGVASTLRKLKEKEAALRGHMHKMLDASLDSYELP